MNLISKKDLLLITKISYGQLYRWKRENLIPEEWFIKQSSYTGQETFFPREQILSRVNSIIELKDKYSLDELSRIFSTENSSVSVSIYDLELIDEIDKELLRTLPNLFGKDKYEFIDIIFIIALSELRQKKSLTIKEIGNIIISSLPIISEQRTTDFTCIVFKVNQNYHLLVLQKSGLIKFDTNIDVIDTIYISELGDKIKLKYENIFSSKAIVGT